MSDTPGTPRSPFTPPPRMQPPPSTAPPARGGCGKPAVIGCLVLLILTGIGLLAGLYYAGRHYDQILVWTLDRIRDGVAVRLPRDLSAEERQRLEAAFTSAKGVAAAIRRDPSVAQKVQLQLLDLAQKAQGTGTLSRQQVEEIIRTLEQIGEAGKTPPAASPAARPASTALRT
jgi:hypothetical protein